MFATAPVTSLASPAEWLVVDIETGNAPEAAIINAIAKQKPAANAKTIEEINADAMQAIANWKAPSNFKDSVKIAERRQSFIESVETERLAAIEKIVERQTEVVTRIRDRSALLDSAPILCIGMQTEVGVISFNGMNEGDCDINGVRVVSCGDERSMLIAVREWAEYYTSPDTVIVGHNIKGFDLPKIRNAYMRHKLILPAVFAPRIAGESQSVVDTASLFRSFSVEHKDDFCPSLSAMCSTLDIPLPKSVVSGSEVPSMHSEGKYHDILIYNVIDVMATTRAYLLMSGQANDLA